MAAIGVDGAVAGIVAVDADDGGRSRQVWLLDSHCAEYYYNLEIRDTLTRGLFSWSREESLLSWASCWN